MDPTNTSDVRPVIHKLFKTLQSLYWPNFCRGMSEEMTIFTKRIWDRKLEKFSEERINHVSLICSDHYPGNIKVGEFRKLCVSRPELATRQYRLEQVKSNQVIGNETLPKILAGLRQKMSMPPGDMSEKDLQKRKKVLAEQANQLESK